MTIEEACAENPARTFAIEHAKADMGTGTHLL